MRKRITYANVAATLALVFSMTGGAIAANHYLINSTKQINPKVLKKLRGNRGAKGATGGKGATGATGAAGVNGSTGKAGETGAPGTAVAYALVNADGTVDPAHSKGVTSANVTKESTSAYCFRNLGFTPKAAVATVQLSVAAPKFFASVAIPGSVAADCSEAPGTTQVEIGTVNAEAKVFAPAAFFVFFE
jgi:Collagen triple helix repeat (20 copies)